eukprot:195881-Amphidinium_carterae.2
MVLELFSLATTYKDDCKKRRRRSSNGAGICHHDWLQATLNGHDDPPVWKCIHCTSFHLASIRFWALAVLPNLSPYSPHAKDYVYLQKCVIRMQCLVRRFLARCELHRRGLIITATRHEPMTVESE